jgi:SAM-dependent methyltransferase
VNDDRVSELYLGEGKFATSASHVPCKTRIDWMVSQTRGRALDIGSSQGITSILLGRAGHDVTGIEIEEPAIEYARKALAAEPVDVRRWVKFLHADIYGDALAGQQFDTVILGEILEHHADPRRLWLRAAEFVAPTGRIVGTTPFGLHPHPDHRVTFYLRNFMDTIRGVGTLTHLDLEDGFIRFIVAKGPQASAVDVSADALLALSEQAFLVIQENAEQLRQSYRSRGERLAAANERITAAGEKAKALSQKLEQAKAELAASRAEAIAERDAHRQMRTRLEQLESYTTPPEDAGPRLRGFSAFLASLLREVNTGGLREAPLQALRKTYARVRRAAGRELGSGD